MCKNAPNKKLHYLGCPIHRIVKGFVAQGGDVTRNDGSGGEVSFLPAQSFNLHSYAHLHDFLVNLRRQIRRRKTWSQNQTSQGQLSHG